MSLLELYRFFGYSISVFVSSPYSSLVLFIPLTIGVIFLSSRLKDFFKR